MFILLQCLYLMHVDGYQSLQDIMQKWLRFVDRNKRRKCRKLAFLNLSLRLTQSPLVRDG